VALRLNSEHSLLIHKVSTSHTKRCTTVGKTPLDEWSARHRDLYLTTHNPHRQKKHPCHGGIFFSEPTIPAGQRRQTYAVERADTWTGTQVHLTIKNTAECNLICVAYLLPWYGSHLERTISFMIWKRMGLDRSNEGFCRIFGSKNALATKIFHTYKWQT